jgi:hypothetical protein
MCAKLFGILLPVLLSKKPKAPQLKIACLSYSRLFPHSHYKCAEVLEYVK